MIKNEKEWPWGDELDAVLAAPNSHKISLENDWVRTLEVTIPPGVKEPMHTHKLPSVMIVTSSASIRYWDAEGKASEYPKRETDKNPFYEWLEPEGLHSVENIDDHPYVAIRIELKRSSS